MYTHTCMYTHTETHCCCQCLKFSPSVNPLQNSEVIPLTNFLLQWPIEVKNGTLCIFVFSCFANNYWCWWFNRPLHKSYMLCCIDWMTIQDVISYIHTNNAIVLLCCVIQYITSWSGELTKRQEKPQKLLLCYRHKSIMH